jgi:hypothetical protein
MSQGRNQHEAGFTSVPRSAEAALLSAVGSACSRRNPMGTNDSSCSSLLFPVEAPDLRKRIALLAACFMVVSCLVYISKLKLEVI